MAPINIAGPTDLKLQEAAAAVALVQKAIHPEAQIVWGLSLDDAYGDEVRVTVIAAGFDANSKKPDQPAEEKPAAAKENTVPLSALSAGVQAPAQQPQPVQTPAVPQVQPLSSYIPSTPDQNVASFDQTTEHEVVSANDGRPRYSGFPALKSTRRRERNIHGRFHEERDVVLGNVRRRRGRG